MITKAIYTLFVGLLVAFFIGLGIEAFYPSPKWPEHPRELRAVESRPATEPTETAEQKAIREKYEAESNKYTKETLPRYNRNVSMIALIASVVILIISLLFMSRIQLLSDGLLFGGLLTLAYSLIRSMMSQDVKYNFLAVTIGLVVALVLGYIKFIKPEQQK